jgi:UDP-N-acetylglucosamine--N-acetylmuramyl-(pentapeptide) pyrophosphoryl-undecaprenol N-acetylglucosamine transferase
LPGGTWVGNPVRRPFWGFERDLLSREAREHYAVGADRLVLGVFGGSLGAKAINDAVAEMLEHWEGPRLQVVHLTGDDHLESMRSMSAPATVEWVRRGFEDRMELFYAVSDLVVARAGGAVAELTATATPSVLIPGSFGSGGHQAGNASGLASAGAAVVITEGAVSDLSEVVRRLVSDDAARADMAAAARAISKPEAALTIASAMIEAAS